MPSYLTSLPPLVLAEQMRAWEQRASHAVDTPLELLMESAAHAVVNHALAQWQVVLKQMAKPPQPEFPSAVGSIGQAFQSLPHNPTKSNPPKPNPHCVVLCGAGNNGGDGYAAARLFKAQGCSVQVIGFSAPQSSLAKSNAARWRYFGEVIAWDEQELADNAFAIETARDTAIESIVHADILIDALFGIGLNRALSQPAIALLKTFNASEACIKIGVDIPSGINANTGQLWGEAARCTHTITFHVGKVGLYQYPAADYAGQIITAPLPLPVYPHSNQLQQEAHSPPNYLITTRGMTPLLPQRTNMDHKGRFGYVLCLCGSAGMEGAALLAAQAAIYSGAGRVSLGVPQAMQASFNHRSPEIMVLSPPLEKHGTFSHFSSSDATFFCEKLSSHQAICVLGCGLGRSANAQQFVAELLTKLAAADHKLPVVIDADGLFDLTPFMLRQLPFDVIITPHPGEFERLFGVPIAQQNQDRVTHARKAAAESKSIVVLKGANSVVALPSGEAFINATGDAGLAKGGSGDVLAGMIGALCAQQCLAAEAAVLGVHLHGLARECLSKTHHPAFFTSSMLLKGIDLALQCIQPIE